MSTRDPVPAVQAFHCHQCGQLVRVGEPVYNAANKRICALCWPKPR